jgi:hypothetical protein
LHFFREETGELINGLLELSKKGSWHISQEEEYCEYLFEAWEKLVEKTDRFDKDWLIAKGEDGEKEKPVKENEKKDLKKFGEKGIESVLEYTLPMSSYGKALPGKKVERDKSDEASLKLLWHWEKNIIPKIQDFVRGTFHPWEMVFYFEQLREWLRKGDSAKALQDALVMCEGKMPHGCIIRDQSYDWSVYIPQQCIIGTWAAATLAFRNDAQSSHPFLTRLINHKINKLAVMIKAVDWRYEVVLCHYTDIETLQLYPLIVPISSLRELEKPLKPPASAFSLKQLLFDFNQNCIHNSAIYARKTLLQLITATHEPLKLLGSEVYKNIKLIDVIKWTIKEEMNEDRIEGWLNNLSSIIVLDKKEDTNELLSYSDPSFSETLLKKLEKSKATKDNHSKVALLQNEIQRSIKADDLSQ